MDYSEWNFSSSQGEPREQVNQKTSFACAKHSFERKVRPKD